MRATFTRISCLNLHHDFISTDLRHLRWRRLEAAPGAMAVRRVVLGGVNYPGGTKMARPWPVFLKIPNDPPTPTPTDELRE